MKTKPRRTPRLECLGRRDVPAPFGTALGTRFALDTVMIQEGANAFGPGNSTDRVPVIYETYQGSHGRAASDIAALQAHYGGARSADAFEGHAGNDTFGTATDFDP